jgi:hypothetical protein
VIDLPAERIVRGAATAMLSWQPYGADGEPADPGGAVTVAVTRADGTVVFAAGTSTAGTGSNPRTIAVSAGELRQTDWLTATWSVGGVATAETVAEVVGGTIGTVAELRALDATLNGRSDDELKESRARVEDLFTDALNRGLVERFYVERVDGSGSKTLIVTWPNVRAVRFVRCYDAGGTYTGFTASEVAAVPPNDASLLVRTDGGCWPKGCRNIEVGYTYGLTAIPRDLRKAMYRAVRHDLVSTRSGIPDRAISFQPAEGGNVVLATPGMGRWVTGIPEIDEAIIRHRFHRPLVG